MLSNGEAWPDMDHDLFGVIRGRYTLCQASCMKGQNDFPEEFICHIRTVSRSLPTIRPMS